MKRYISPVLMFLALTSLGQADGGGTRDEAHRMTVQAARYLRENGPDKAFAAFGQAGAPFHDRDLYVIVFDKTGKNVAHGALPGQIGKDLINLKDIDGVPFVQQIVAVKGEGIVTYQWPNPETKQVQPKAVFVEQVDGYFVGVGTYAAATRSILDVKQAASDAGAAASQVLGAAAELARHSNELDEEVNSFLVAVKAA